MQISGNDTGFEGCVMRRVERAEQLHPLAVEKEMLEKGTLSG
jgi:hypothetical protein